MDRAEFETITDETIKEYDCFLIGLDYYEDEKCKVTFTDGIVYIYFYIVYSFMDSSKLKTTLKKTLDLYLK